MSGPEGPSGDDTDPHGVLRQLLRAPRDRRRSELERIAYQRGGGVSVDERIENKTRYVQAVAAGLGVDISGVSRQRGRPNLSEMLDAIVAAANGREPVQVQAPSVTSDLTPLDRIALADLAARGSMPLARLRRVYAEQTQAEQDAAIARLRNAGLIAVDGRTVTITGKGGWLDASNRAPAPDTDSALTRLDRPRRARDDEPEVTGRRTPGTGTGVPAAPVVAEPMSPRTRPRLRALERRVFANLIRQSGDRTGQSPTTIERLQAGMPDMDPAEIRRVLDQLAERGQLETGADGTITLTSAGRARWDAPRRTRLGIPQPNMDEIPLPARRRFTNA